VEDGETKECQERSNSDRSVSRVSAPAPNCARGAVKLHGAPAAMQRQVVVVDGLNALHSLAAPEPFTVAAILPACLPAASRDAVV